MPLEHEPPARDGSCASYAAAEEELPPPLLFADDPELDDVDEGDDVDEVDEEDVEDAELSVELLLELPVELEPADERLSVR